MKKKQSEIKAGIMKFAQQEYIKLIEAEMKKHHIPMKAKEPTAKEEITKNAGVKKTEKKDDGLPEPTPQDLEHADVAEAQAKKMLERGRMKEAQEHRKRAKDLRSGLTRQRREANKKKVGK